MRTKEIEKLILNHTKRPLVIGIDGRCASGKTTLANTLGEILHANVFHMDDYFLRVEQRTKQRFEEIGGNVDRERFLLEIGNVLHTNKDIVYTPFDCKTMALSKAIHCKQTPITIIEGSYCMHQDLQHLYDIKIYLTINADLQIQRLKQRNPEKLEMFINRWIPLEEKYFQTYHLEKQANIILEAEDW